MSFFFFNDPATTEIYTLSLHDALPISLIARNNGFDRRRGRDARTNVVALRRAGASIRWLLLAWLGITTAARVALHVETRSEEHTSELQSQFHLVCRLLLEKKNKKLHKQ